MNLRQAAEMALEFVSWFASDDHSVRPKHKAPEIAEALRQALAQEWVCCVCGDPKALGIVHSADAPCFHYTKREWVGLTDDEIWDIGVDNQRKGGGFWGYPRAIEAKLKEKNT